MHKGCRVEVVYALPDRQTLISLQVPPQATLREAVQTSGVMQHHPELHEDSLVLGVHGRKRLANELVSDGDRIEIYRPLTTDPKDNRRQRAKARAKPTLRG